MGRSVVSRYQLLGFSLPKEYLAAHIHDLRVLPTVVEPEGGWGIRRSPMKLASFNDGVIAFDYGAKTVRIAGGIDEAEGKQIIALIQQRFPYDS